MSLTAHNDAELVGASLSGNRDAFGQIVARYQSLVCSLAYSATGSLSQSEDLAQETFLTAWKQLADLREPEKVRAWLCGIARNLINNSLRRQGHEPSHQAESLEEISESYSPEPQPVEQTISNEEAAILWRSLERIPEIYREPLILFYREHQSIGAVAQDLELSEDAVRQRLSRGRKLLQEQFLAFIAGALKQTRPDKAFTLGVMAALPLLTTTAKAATATVTATKSGAMAKATGLGAFFQTVLKAVAGFLGALSPILLLGGYFGFKMGGDARQSAQQRESVTTFWRIMVGCLAAFVALPMLLLVFLAVIRVDVSGDFRRRLLGGMTLWLGLMYAVVPAALFLWAWQRRRKGRSQSTAAPEVVGNSKKKKRLGLWLIIAMIGTACLLVLCLLDTNKKVQYITTVEVQKMVADTKGKDVQFSISQYQNGQSNFWIMLRENGKRTMFSAPVDDATLALLKEQGIKCPTYVQGRDFEVFGWPGRLLPLFCIFILAIGGVVLLRRPGKFNPQEMDAQQAEKMRRMERVANKAFAVCIALVLLTAALLFGLYFTRWNVRTLSTAEVQKMAADLKVKGANFIVYQYSNGTKELCIQPNFIAPADAATLSILAANGINYMTLVQGRDFGFGMPKHGVALFCIFILVGGAGIILWRVSPKAIAVVVALVLVAMAILVGLRTAWHARSLSTAEARTMIVEHQSARFQIIEYSNGSRELWITPPGSTHYIATTPCFIATADDSMFALLAENKITFHTSFGYGLPRRGTALLYISTLVAGAVVILWWAWKKERKLPAPAEANG